MSSLFHLAQLSIINYCDDYIGNEQRGVDSNQPVLASLNVLLKFRGFIFFVIGAVLGLFSHFTLLWSRWRHMRLWKRLTIGIGGWSVAVVLIWHGATLVLGID
jgi:hypothetical protein